MSIPAHTRSRGAMGRRGFLAFASLATLAVGATACGTSGPAGSNGGGGGAGSATMWFLTGDPNETICSDSVDAFNELDEGNLEVTFYQNDAYKTKIRTAVGADQAPTVIFGWGGGILKSYVDAGQVDDLTDFIENTPDFKAKFTDSVWSAATIEDKIYAVPTNSTQPIVMYYNNELFDKHGADLPKTWDDVMGLVELFNGKGVAPFSLGGQSKWTSMMWLEYLLDRIGGPEAFDAILSGDSDAWSQDAVIKTCTMIQDLVKADGFIKGFSSIAADGNADQAVLYTGKAAMMLHGSWVYGSMKSAQPDFVASSLGFGPFPEVAGGQGDPTDIVGGPANYLSISSGAADGAKEVAKSYFADGLYAEADIEAFIATGGVPPVKAAQDKLASSEDADFLTFIYGLVSEASNFELSWDQALSPAEAEALLNNIGQLFLLGISPEEFASNMNATLGK